jgi:hypothetical protein
VDLTVRCGMKTSTLYSLVPRSGTALAYPETSGEAIVEELRSRRTVASKNIIAATDVAYVVS